MASFGSLDAAIVAVGSATIFHAMVDYNMASSRTSNLAVAIDSLLDLKEKRKHF